MKKSILYLSFLSIMISFSACQSEDESTDNKTISIENINVDAEKAKVSELLDILAQATESGNVEMVEKIWCPKEGTMLIGTENDEKLVGWSEIKEAVGRQSGEFSEILIAITDQNIWLDEDARTAWFFEELNYNFIYNDKAMSFEGIRFTGVFVKSVKNEWKLVQAHMSVPSVMDVE